MHMARVIVQLEVEVRTHEVVLMEFYPETFAAQIAAGREWLALMADPEYFEARVLAEIAKGQFLDRLKQTKHRLPVGG
jgi:hypothetical protein